MSDQEATEKKLKSRIRKFKKVIKDDDEKSKFFETIGISLEIFLPTKDPEVSNDGIILYTSPEGKVVDAEYYFQEGEENPPYSMPLSDKDLKVVVDMLNEFKVESSN